MCCHLVALSGVQIIRGKCFSLKKKNRFAELSPSSQCGLHNLLRINFLSVSRQNQRGKNRVAVESDAYGFERTLAFATIHPWVK